MNWYILYCLSARTEKLVKSLNQEDNLYAFIPRLEYYRRDIKGYALKPLFPSYIFVKSRLNQAEFDSIIRNMKEEKDGLIKQLKYNDVSALREEEITMFEKLLDDQYILTMSKAFIKDKKASITEGPLKYFENNIMKVDRHNQLAYLDLKFMGRYILAGLFIKGRI